MGHRLSAWRSSCQQVGISTASGFSSHMQLLREQFRLTDLILPQCAANVITDFNEMWHLKSILKVFDQGKFWSEFCSKANGLWGVLNKCLHIRGCIQKFPDWVDNEMNDNKHLLRSNTKGYGGKKLTRVTCKIAIQLHLVVESCTICSSRSRRPVRKLLDTPSKFKLLDRLEMSYNN
jgi:hypothetical protein